MEYIVNKLKESYPDVAILEEIVTEMNAKVQDIASKKEDNRYTPAVLLLALIYKYQKIAEEDDLHAEAQTLDPDLQEQVEYLCALYWHHIHATGVIMRIAISGADPELIPDMTEANRQALAIKLGIDEEDVIMTWVSEMEGRQEDEEDNTKRVMGHTPDFAISIDRKRQCIVITLLGTRITPKPKMHDILMDLCATPVPWLDGLAHAGMAAGTQNIIQRSLDTVLQALEDNTGYSLLVVGYSLGAGLAQLYTMELMEGESALRIPDGTKIRCLSYGTPPVFNCPDNKRSYENIITIENNTDGIIGASVKTVNDLFAKMVVIDQLDIPKRTMTKMMFDDGTILDDEEEEEETLEDVTRQLEERTKKTLATHMLGPLGSLFGKLASKLSGPDDNQAQWVRVADALNNMPRNYEENLYNVGQHLLVMKNQEDGSRSVNKFTNVEQTEKFTRDMRLKSGMFPDHMPWGYTGLFGGDTWMPDESREVALDVLDQI